MGYGSWKRDTFVSYSTSKGLDVSDTGVIIGDYSNQDLFKSRQLDEALNPKNVVRECCDSEDHPNSFPVILALDVTGSMGQAAVEVAKQLNVLMTNLYEKVNDVEFMIMGIGDLAYDNYPIQASQFESDIRIAEQLDKVYFEFGGGGNSFESYTAAWYFGLNNTKLDCWARGRKGLIITMGDELLNPYLPKVALQETLGASIQGDVDTKDLYSQVIEKFDLYHINVLHGNRSLPGLENSWVEVLGDQCFKSVELDDVSKAIEDIIVGGSMPISAGSGVKITEDGIAW